MPKKTMTKEQKQLRNHKKEVKRLHDNMISEKDDIEKQFDIPEPCHVFKVGDRVQYGRWEWTAILEVCEDGKYYKVMKITHDTPYGIYKGEKMEIGYLSWIQIEPYRSREEIIKIKRFTEDDDLHLNYSQRQIGSLMHMLHQSYSGIDMNPDYQRGNVWSHEQEVSLIKSIFENVDIGKFTIIKRPFKLGDYGYEVLDGKQRITALSRFFTGRFKYKGKTFFELHTRDQGHLENYSISYAEIAPLTQEQKYKYFIKLNTSGVPVDPLHMETVKRMLEDEKEKK